jgi:hypothetical protein
MGIGGQEEEEKMRRKLSEKQQTVFIPQKSGLVVGCFSPPSSSVPGSLLVEFSPAFITTKWF